MLKFISKSFDFILLVAIVLSVLFVFIDFQLTMMLVAALVLVLLTKKVLVFLSSKLQKKLYR